MSRVRSYTVSAIRKTLGCKVEHWDCGKECGELRHEVSLRTCIGSYVAEGEGPTKKAAIAALEAKLRDCAKAVLSDEYDWEE